MKTEQEQIEEMAKYICNVCEMGFSFNGDCSEGGQDYYKRCTLTQETAKALYDAGYRKTFTSDIASDTQRAFKDGYIKATNDRGKEIAELNAENAILKTNLKKLEEKCEELRNEKWDAQDDLDCYYDEMPTRINQAVKEFAEKLKEKALLHCRTINCYECKFIETMIDELLEEYEK